MNKEYVSRFEIVKVLPCFTTPGYICFIAKGDKRLDNLLTTIYLMFPPGKASYSKSETKLTLYLWDRLVTICSDGTVAVTNTRDLDEAREVLSKIKKIISDAYNKYIILTKARLLNKK